jgi:hypothetical protein
MNELPEEDARGVRNDTEVPAAVEDERCRKPQRGREHAGWNREAPHAGRANYGSSETN